MGLDDIVQRHSDIDRRPEQDSNRDLNIQVVQDRVHHTSRGHCDKSRGRFHITVCVMQATVCVTL
jgi:hypothetical protein